LNVLGFDTATSATAVGLLREADSALAESRDAVEPGARGHHAEQILVQARELLVAASLGWDELDLIAVGVGPGGYTGLRIGLATARGLALSLGVRLVGVGSLRALAEPVRGTAAVTLLDARRGELFAAAYLDDVEVLAPRVIGPDQIAATFGALAGPAIAIGDGALAHAGLLEHAGIAVAGADSPLHRMSGGAVCAVGLRSGDASAAPLYLRRPDAELALEAKQ
jgi:tRNA threonylcarbamoyladenosine biosynthesis protein TsaB